MARRSSDVAHREELGTAEENQENGPKQMTVDIEQVRRDTAEIMSGIEGWSAEYITEDFLGELESVEEVMEQPVLEDDLQTTPPWA